MRPALIAGVGMTAFAKPGIKDGDYPDWVAQAAGDALVDAGVAYGDVQMAFAGYVYGESTAGQRALYELGLTGIPVINVNNNCSTGSSALWLARQAVASGTAECVLAVGFEKMERGSLQTRYVDRANPLDRHLARSADLHGRTDSPFAVQLFGNAGRDHMRRHGSEARHFAWIAWKNHKHSQGNPNAQFQDEYSLEEIEDSTLIHAPLTKLQCSPTSDGAAAALVVSGDFARDRGLVDRAVEIAGQAVISDMPSSFAPGGDAIALVGADMTRVAAELAFTEAGLAPADVDVCELHDCFSTNELISYEALGLARPGEGHRLVERQATTYGGDGPVVNPSGGLISKGHPLGATGLAQCAELTWQLRDEAGVRQVNGAEIGLQHNIGLGGAAVVTVYRGPGAR